MTVLFVKKLPSCKQMYFAVDYVISRLFQKWGSCGVVSTSPCQEIIDFTGFSRTFQDTAVADETYLNHNKIPPEMR